MAALLVRNFGKSRPCPWPVQVEEVEVELVDYKYLGLWPDKFDWTCYTRPPVEQGPEQAVLPEEAVFF